MINFQKTLFVSIVFLISFEVLAESATTTFNVTAVVNPVCLVNVNSLVFGPYDPTSSVPLDADTMININCTANTPFSIGLSPGMGVGATAATRLMTHTTDSSQTIAYSMYSDSNHSNTWGDTVGTDTLAGTGNGTMQQITIYGRIFSSNSVSLVPATYSDTITVTVTF